MSTRRIVNGVSLEYEILDPAVDEIFAVHSPGSTVKQIAEKAGADIALNFNYADTVKGLPIGRVIVGGKVVVQDIAKTVARDELYMLPDRSIHIGKAPANAVWAVQGSPRLLKGGTAAVGSIQRDQLGADIWERAAHRTAVGLTAAGELVLVRTYTEVFLPQLTTVMLELGCVDALNGDGGGSSYMWPVDNGWGRKLGAALCAKRGVKPMVKLIAIDDGHGMQTAGKRTPLLLDGTVMRENEFDRSVAAKLKVHLERCCFRTLMTAPTDADTPLKARTDAADNANADLFISIHANAIGAGGWNGTRGIETFHYLGRADGEKAAKVIHRNLIAGTKLPDRGVKTANFYVLRETNMPAVLVECAFMTNQEDARLLLTESYRDECAEELARGICEYFGVPFVRPSSLPTITRTVMGRLNVAEVPDAGYLIAGKTFVPLRWIAESAGFEVEWDPDKFEYDLITKGK